MKNACLCILLTLAGSLAFAQNSAESPLLLSEHCEEALALSAMPAHLRENAGTWVYSGEHYRSTRPAKNGFSCHVERNHPRSVIPVCYDAEGSDKILPAKQAAAEIIMAGGTREEVAQRFSAAVESGDYLAPEKPGLAYMVSAHNRIFTGTAIQSIDPHLMFYVPNMENADIGGSMQAARSNRGLPFVIEPGIHGFAISYVGRASDSSAVFKHCAGELPDGYL
jgi:hypothetical protein